MADIIQTNAGAMSKSGGGSLSITAMAAAVKELPEYRQTMSKLSQHVSIAQQCMDAFGAQGLMQQSQLEQTMSTGVDEDGKEVKGTRLVELLKSALSAPGLEDDQKIRLLCIFIVSQRGATPDEKRQLIQASRLSGEDQQIFLNLERLCLPVQTAQSATGKAAGNIFSSLFKGRAPTHAATAEGEYADTRHVGQLKGIVEHMLNNDLPLEKYASVGNAGVKDGESKAVARSVRRNVGANSKFGRATQGSFAGGRNIVFIAGGCSFSELRVAHDVMAEKNKEIIMGGTHLINPNSFIEQVSELNKAPTTAAAKAVGSRAADSV
jgi:syntaxin-binding protein 1